MELHYKLFCLMTVMIWFLTVKALNPTRQIRTPRNQTHTPQQYTYQQIKNIEPSGGQQSGESGTILKKQCST